MGKIIILTTTEKNIGKTTSAAALSSCFALCGHKTLCIDFDTKSPSLGAALGMSGEDSVNVDEVFDGRLDITEAYHEHPDIPDLFYFRVSPDVEISRLNVAGIMRMFDDIRGLFDYCLIDTPAEACTSLMMGQADLSLIITDEDMPALTAALRATETSHSMGISDIQLLVNRIKPKSFKLHWTPLDDMLEIMDARLIGLILEDKTISRANREEVPLATYKKKRAINDYRDAARRIAGEDIPWRLHLNQPYISSVSVKRVSSKLVGNYGDPELWAKSTIEHDTDKLFKIYEIRPGKTISPDTIRNRFWIHDLFDDEGIPYKVSVSGFWATRKKFLEAQSIYVEISDRSRARDLIIQYYDPKSILHDPNVEIHFDGEYLQKRCPSCGEFVDFDYPKCPHCKTSLT